MHIPGGFLSNLTLKSKIGLIVVIGLLLVISVFGYLGLTALGRSTEARLQERLTIALLVADYQDQVLGLALKGLEVAAGSLDKRTTDAGERFDLAGRELASLYTTLSQLGLPIGDVFVLDREGRKVWGVLPWLDSDGAQIALDPSLQRTVTTGNSSVSGLTSVPSIDVPVVLLSSSVRAGEGVLVAAVDLSRSSIASLMKPLQLGETGYAELVDEKGVVLARTSPGRAPTFFEKSDHPDKFAALIASGKPAVGTCHRCHIEAEQTTRRKDVLAFAPLSQASWGVAIRQSEEEALAVTRELKQGLIAAGALMSAVTLGLIWLATSNVVTRIRSLNTAALKMASGDLSTSIPVHGRDELGALAQTLDSTRIELKTSYEAVEQRTRELGALFAISKTLTSTPEVSMMLDAVMAKVVEVIPGSDGGLLLLYDGDTDRFLLKSAVGIGSGLELKDVAIPRHADIQATPAMHCAIPPELPPELHQLTETICAEVLRLGPVQARVRNAAGAPLVSRGQLMGILILGNFRDNVPFTSADLHLLQALANEVAMAVETVRLSHQEEEGRLLRETDRLKSEFLSIVSHELRTPLTSIKGYATSLLRKDVTWDPETSTEFLQTIDKKTDELRDLIDKLLQMARVEAGGLVLRREPVLLNRLAQEVIADVAPNSPGHRFDTDFSTPFPVVEGDLHNLKIVLGNLVDNAVKYSPRGGRILLSGKVDDSQVTISVTDEGIGIPANQLDKIFDRFFRVSNDSTSRVGGSGLGLAVVKALIEAHGGKVWVESQEGQGSTFFFTLPMESTHDGEADLHTGR